MYFSQLCSRAEHQLQREGKHPATLITSFASLPTPVRRTFPTLPATADQRHQFLFSQGRFLAQHYAVWRLQRIWFITEFWIHPLKRGSSSSSPTPKHREGLVVLELDVTTPDLPHQEYMRPFHRNAKKKVTGFSEPVDTHGGRMLGAHLYPFLAGFTEHALQDYGPVRQRLVQAQIQMDLALQQLK